LITNRVNKETPGIESYQNERCQLFMFLDRLEASEISCHLNRSL